MLQNINFKSIHINDKNVLDSYFKSEDSGISEYSFTNLYAWSQSREIKLGVLDKTLFLCACYDNEKYLLQPFNSQDINRDLKDILTYVREFGIDSARRIGPDIAKRLDPDLYEIIEDRDNYDYIYDTGKLAHLKGRKYSNKRAFVKKFTEAYDYSYFPYDKSMLDNVLELTEKWLDRKNDNGDKSIYNEYKAITYFLEQYDELDALGGVLKVEGAIVAYAFGEALNSDTFVIHFEKADTDYVGGYQTINQLFVQNEVLGKFTYVNREQDIGIPGIRKAKSSYLPVKMGEKYTVKLRN